MKIEPRGKYPGIKIHLDEIETRQIMVAAEVDGFAKPTFPIPDGKSPKITGGFIAGHFVGSLNKKIRKLLVERPDLLAERTPEQIKEELEEELKKSQLKLAAIAKGDNWKKVTV